ncbi:MAG: helix-turn-helix transcriptional regulator [Bacteroidaceae bacterium]|nr:helix-turn-helix transcriptional regulator [Bacteroidaceae bacterium]
MDVKDRIKLLMDSVKMSQQEFAKVLGITPGSLSGILNERTRPTNNHTLAVHKAFPNISINWLLFGEGEMYNDAHQNERQETTEVPESSNSLFGHEENPSQSLNLFSREVHNDGAKNGGTDELPRADSPTIIKRCVKEIRIFYDDGTYESFTPSEK